MPRWLLRLALLITVTLGACQREPASQPISDILDVAPSIDSVELSEFSVPLEYDFTQVLRVIERAVPSRFGSLDSIRTMGNDSRRQYAYEADREPFTAFADGKVVRLRSTLAYAAKGYYKPIIGPTLGAGCGDKGERPRISIQLSTPITLTSNWHLQSRAQLDNIAPASADERDRCDVGIPLLRRDVTDRVIDAARNGITSRLGDIDRRIGRVSLDSRMERWWNLLAHPIRLADGVWLTIGPERLAIGTVQGHDQVLTVPVTLSARPRIVTSDVPPVTRTLKPPPLARGGSTRGFRILIDGLIDYATASEVVGSALVNREITQAGQTVTVNAVRVTPASQGRLALAVDFSGAAKGTLVFLGRPVLDTVRREIVVPDLDYDLDTDNQLINSYSWLRSDDLRATFRDRAHVPIDSALERGRKLLLGGLNRTIGGVMTLSATVDSVGLRGVYVTKDGLVVRGEARGKARVAVKQK